jgi:hypothetical protein
VGSKTFDGVWFVAYSHDHPPPHVHGFYTKTEVLIDLLPDGKVGRSKRRGSVRPPKGKRNEVRRILEVAAAHAAELHELWLNTHGGKTHG